VTPTRGDRTVGQVCRDFDLTETAVGAGSEFADLDAGTRTDGLTTSERGELDRLRRETGWLPGLSLGHLMSSRPLRRYATRAG
jgi:hypothetical protein